MLRFVFPAIVGLFLLGIGSIDGGSTTGPFKTNGRVDPGTRFEFKHTFRANERACVIIEGDHEPVMNLTVKVLDPEGKTVAADVAGKDIICAIWYPPKTQEYRLFITSDDKKLWNDVTLYVK